MSGVGVFEDVGLDYGFDDGGCAGAVGLLLVRKGIRGGGEWCLQVSERKNSKETHFGAHVYL